MSVGSDAYLDDDVLFLPRASVQDAFIRLFNQYISPELIQKALFSCIDCDINYEELSYAEFCSLYRRLEDLYYYFMSLFRLFFAFILVCVTFF